MKVNTAPEMVAARRVLLDALDALGPHRDAVVLVGGDAVVAASFAALVAELVVALEPVTGP